jgi:hypothetical protein
MVKEYVLCNNIYFLMQKKEIEAHFYRIKCFYNCKIQSKISLSELICNSFFILQNILWEKKVFIATKKMDKKVDREQ